MVNAVEAIAGYGAAWLLLAAALAKAGSGTATSASIGGALWRLGLVAVELAAALLALSPVAMLWPTAGLMFAFGLGNFWFALRSPGMRCGCYGSLDPDATYSVGKGVALLALAFLSLGSAISVSPVGFDLDDAVARLAGLVVPIAVIGGSAISGFREVFE
jgi:hypothetical protein